MIESGKARLRPAEDRDLELLASMRNDIALQLTLLALPRPNTEQRVRDWIAARSQDPQVLFFVIASRDTDRAAGFVQIAAIDPINGSGELGIALADASRGQGLGGDALAALEAHARGVFGLRKLTLRVLGDNERAIAFYERTGYRRVGVLREHHYQNDSYRDVLIMEKFLRQATAS